MMFGNQIRPLHWNRSEGWILDRGAPGDGGQNISVSIAQRNGRSWTRRGRGAQDHSDSLSRICLERSGSPSAKSTFNGNENSLNYATAKFMSSAERSNERGGCDFISWRVMCEGVGGGGPHQNLLFTTRRCGTNFVHAISVSFCCYFLTSNVSFVIDM